jgi:integrase
VTREEAQKVLDACPNAEWRLIFALTHFGGLRIPSELMQLRWGDIDWERGRMTVRSPKTADGKGVRLNY